MSRRGKPDDGLRAILHEHLLAVHWQAIESGYTSKGIPDSNYCYRGVEGWIECKATTGWAVDLEPEQIGWIARRVRCGGRVHVAVRRRHDGGPRRGPPADELWLIRIHNGEWVKSLKLGGLLWARESGLQPWTGGPSRWDWAQVLHAITRP